MPDLPILLSFAALAFLLVIVPGPSVTVIVANSLRYGLAAGLLTVAGTQTGAGLMILVLALGFSAIVESMALIFEILRWIGAAYLIWLGIKMWRSDGSMADVEAAGATAMAGRSFFFHGFLVICSNPKALLFFGALLPQFVNTAGGNMALQTILLGSIFLVVATIFDSTYAFAAVGARRLLSRSRVRIVEKISGTALIFGGLWLVTARRAS